MTFEFGLHIGKIATILEWKVGRDLLRLGKLGGFKSLSLFQCSGTSWTCYNFSQVQHFKWHSNPSERQHEQLPPYWAKYEAIPRS